MASQQIQFRDLKCAISSFIANYIAGILHPFDLIKTRFQSHDGKDAHINLVPKYRGIIHAFAQIYQTEGLKGFFKGFYMSLFSQAVASSFFFWLYQKRKQKMLEEKQPIMRAVTYASLEAGIIATVATQPFWVIKTRMLLNTDPHISQRLNFVEKTKQIYGQYGLKGYSKGLSVNLALAVIGATQMYFYQGSRIVYDYLKIPQTQYSQKNFICGGVSRILSGLVMYPFTTVRTRLQQNQYVNSTNVQKYSGALDIFKRIGRQEGVRGFYKGLTANILKGIPQKGMYFYFYELIKGKIFNIHQFKSE